MVRSSAPQLSGDPGRTPNAVGVALSLVEAHQALEVARESVIAAMEELADSDEGAAAVLNYVFDATAEGDAPPEETRPDAVKVGPWNVVEGPDGEVSVEKRPSATRRDD